TGINNAGQVVGISQTTGNEARHAFLYSDGTMTDLGTLGGQNSSGLGINDLGHVVGDSDRSVPRHHAFLFDGKSMTDLGALDGQGSQANGVNSYDQVVGSFVPADDSAFRATFYTDGKMTELGTFGGRYSTANGINDREEVVGYAQLPNDAQHAFYYNR